MLPTEIHVQVWGCTCADGLCIRVDTWRIPTYAGKPAHLASLPEENVKNCWIPPRQNFQLEKRGHV